MWFPRPFVRAPGIGLAGVALVAMLPALPSLVDSPPSAEAVLLPSCPSTISATRVGSQTTAVHQDNDQGTWDLTGAVWDENAPDPIAYPVRSDSWTKGCLLGGTVLGNIPKSWTRDQWYNGQDGGVAMHGDVFRQTLSGTPDNWLLIRDAYAEDYEDAYDPDAALQSSTTYLDHVRARYVRDDCVENEKVPHNLVITNSLFDGCFTGIAERPSGASAAQNGTGPQFLTVEDSLVYIEPQPLGPNYCDSSKVSLGRCAATSDPNVWLGAYGIWKWSEQAAGTVTVRNTVFRLDMPSYSSCSSQRWPAGTYENVTLVWTGDGAYESAGGCTNVLPAGVTLTTDVEVWNDAKAAWLAGEPTPSPSPSPSPVNRAPVVSAGPDVVVRLGGVGVLDGTVTDDGLPIEGSLTQRWSVVSGPGSVTFEDATAVDTTATFSTRGTYTLRLTASDGELSASDDTVVKVRPRRG